MAITGFDFPKTTLRQVFNSTTAGTSSALSAVVIGPQYNLHRASEEAEAALLASGSDYETGTTLAVAAYPDHKVGCTVDAASVKLVVKNAILAYLTASDGTLVGVSKKTIKFATTVVQDGNNVEASAGFGARGAKVGDPVYVTTKLIADNTPSNAFIAYIVGISASVEGGAYDTIVISRDIAALDTVATVRFCLVQDATFATAELTSVTSSGFTIPASLTEPLTEISGISGTLIAGDFYVDYRELDTTGANVVGAIGDPADVAGILGAPALTNPLALAVYAAAVEAKGRTVYYMPVTAESLAAYTTAIDLLANREDLHGVALATTDPTILSMGFSDVEQISADEDSKTFRVFWYGLDLASEIAVIQNEAAVGDSGGSTVTFENAVFALVPFKEGDVINVSGTRYTITATNNVDAATISGTLSGALDGVVSVIRTSPETADHITDIISRKAFTATRRGRCMFADGYTVLGQVVPNYVLAAACAGMRSYEPVHRPLSMLPHTVGTCAETHSFTRAQYKLLGAQGISVVAKDKSGVTKTFRQLTTAASGDLNLDEESITANADEITMAVGHVGENKVGNSNISEVLVKALKTEVAGVLDYRRINHSGDDYIGPQILSYEITSFGQNPVNRDHIDCTIDVQPPPPFNKFAITIRVI